MKRISFQMVCGGRMKKLFFVILANFLISVFAIAQPISGTFAIQNTVTGKNLRPYEAGNQNGNRIVLYNHVEWKCMTWQFIKAKENTYQLKNLFTSKTFQPSSKAIAGVSLEQQPIKDEPGQYWEFIKQGDNLYLIRLQGSDLYITTSSENTNSSVILQPKLAKTSSQLWKLVEQHPTM